MKVSKTNYGKNVLFSALETYSGTGGVQRFNRRVIDGLSRMAAAAETDRPSVHLLRDTADITLANSPVSIRGFGPDRRGFVTATLARARRADTLLLGHIHLLPVGWLAKKLNPDLRIVLFVHGVEVWNDPVYRKRRFYEPFLLRSVDTVASVSRFTADRMARHFDVPHERFVIFPNAVDITERQASRLGTTLLCVTRMAPHDHGKKIDILLRAFARLPDSLAAARLEIIGDGPLRPRYEALARELGMAARVSFLGRVDDEELIAAYRRARAFVLPSSKEGFGIVYLEAWLHGLPVICGKGGASHEIVDHGIDGFVADETDIAGLSGYMATLLMDEPLAGEMGRRGRGKVEQRYGDGNFQANLVRLLVGGR